MKKKKFVRKEKPNPNPKIPPKLDEKASETDMNDFGGINLGNFKKNLGCGG